MKKRISILLLSLCIVSSYVRAVELGDIVDCVQAHPQKAIAAASACLLARPAVQLLMNYLRSKTNGLGLGSLVGLKCGMKDATDKKAKRFRSQLSVGSFDLKLKVPTEFTSLKKRVKSQEDSFGVSEMIADLVAQFSPYVHVGIAHKDTPLVRDKQEATTAKVKRLFVEFACGTLCMRTGIDLEDVILTPVALAALYLSMMLQEHMKDPQSLPTI